MAEHKSISNTISGMRFTVCLILCVGLFHFPASFFAFSFPCLEGGIRKRWGGRRLTTVSHFLLSFLVDRLVCAPGVSWKDWQILQGTTMIIEETLVFIWDDNDDYWGNSCIYLFFLHHHPPTPTPYGFSDVESSDQECPTHARKEAEAPRLRSQSLDQDLTRFCNWH